MGEAVAGIFAAIGKALAAEGVYGFIARVVFTALVSYAGQKLFGPKAPKGRLSGNQIMTRSSLEYRKIVYGTGMVSGPVVYNNVQGDDNEYLWYQVALCDGKSEDVVSVWFDGEEITKANIDWTAGTGASDGTGTGDVSAARYTGANSTKAARIFYYLGDDNQPVCGALDTAFFEVDSTMRLRGITHVVVRLLYNEDTENVWRRGQVNNIKVLVKGRSIYDPRLDSTRVIDSTTSPITYGTGTHRANDETTWAWSENPSLCAADYLMTIMGVDPETAMDWESIAKAADDCEVQVPVPPSASPENTEDRFTCNGALSMGTTHKENLETIASSMDGSISYSAGTWRVRASVWEASSVSITANDLAGPVEVRGSAPKADRFSTVRGFFIDPDRKHEAVEFPHVTDTTYKTRDNEEDIFFDLELPMTNSVTMAQRIAFRNLEQGNNQIICNLSMNARGAKIAIGDVVDVTLDTMSWTAKTFRCIEWMRNPDGTFKVTLREDNEDSYADPTVANYDSSNTTGVTLPSEVVPAPSNLAATGVSGGIKLTWINPAAEVFDYIAIYEHTSNDWTSSPMPQKIAEVRADTYLVPHDDGVTYYYWIRAVRLPDRESDRNPDSDTSTVSAADTSPPASPINAIGTVAADTNVSPTNSQAAIQMNLDGDLYEREGVGSSFTSVGSWLNSGYTNSDYDYMLSGTGDTPTSGSLDTWYAGNVTTNWQLDETTDAEASKVFNGTMSWRNATTLEILGTASVTIRATVTI